MNTSTSGPIIVLVAIACIGGIALARSAYQATVQGEKNLAAMHTARENQPWVEYQKCLEERKKPVPSYSSSRENCHEPD